MSYPGMATGVASNVKGWIPALAGLMAAIVVATGAGVLLSGLGPRPGSSAPIVLQSATPGALDRAGVHLTQPVLPIECTPAAWIHLSISGRCPVSRGEAEAAARKALPVFKVLVTPTVAIQAGSGAATVVVTTPAPGGASPQVKEAVLVWADVPAGSLPGASNQPLHGLVWVVAIDQPVFGGVMCPPGRVPTAADLGGPGLAAVPRCGGASARYLVFVDALSAKVKMVATRP